MKKLILLLILFASCKPRYDIHYIPNGFFEGTTLVITTKDTFAVKQIFDLPELGNISALTDPDNMIVWVTKKEDVAHEAFHLTKGILEYHNIPLTEDTEEVYAYVQEYYIRRINETLE